MTADGIARRVAASGTDPGHVAAELAAGLAGDGLRLVVVFADWRIATAPFVQALQRALPAPVVGCSTLGVIGAPSGDPPAAAALGFYGDWLRVGIGVATELPKSALARSRDAVHQAVAALGLTVETIDPARHVAFALVDGSCGHEEAFCIASAAAAPGMRVVGGSASTELGTGRRSFVWANGETLADAGVVVMLESRLPFVTVTSAHLVATEQKTVVTAASGRTIDELDGRPAAARLQELVEKLGGALDPSRPSEYSLARFVDGMPYVRSMTGMADGKIQLASAVEEGHVLRVMRPGDLIGQTRRDLADARAKVGGEMAALLAFSCIGRHWEAAARGLERELADAYAEYPTLGFQSFGEQTGMLLVNHTLTALAIGTGA